VSGKVTTLDTTLTNHTGSEGILLG